MLYGLHETPWNPRATRTASSTGRRDAPEWHVPVGNRPKAQVFSQLRPSVEGDTSEKGRNGVKIQTDPRPPLASEGEPEEGPGPSSDQRAALTRLSHGSLDNPPGGGRDPETVWNRLPSESPLAAAPGRRLELSEAGDEGPRKGRGRYCSLEEVSVAPYKKRPKGLVPIWPFWMSRAFCWSLR